MRVNRRNDRPWAVTRRNGRTPGVGPEDPVKSKGFAKCNLSSTPVLSRRPIQQDFQGFRFAAALGPPPRPFGTPPVQERLYSPLLLYSPVTVVESRSSGYRRWHHQLEFRSLVERLHRIAENDDRRRPKLWSWTTHRRTILSNARQDPVAASRSSATPPTSDLQASQPGLFIDDGSIRSHSQSRYRGRRWRRRPNAPIPGGASQSRSGGRQYWRELSPPSPPRP